MSEASPTPAAGEAVLEVVSPDGARRYARVVQSPFLIGRGAETGNHLQLTDRRISRECAAIIVEGNKFHIEDRGQRRGLFVNNEKVESRELKDGDIITFGLEDSYEIVFRSSSAASEQDLPHLLTRIENITSSEPGSGGLRKLRWGVPGRGKRGGVRVIYFWDEPSETFYMLYAYRKNVQEDLTAQQLRVLARLVREEFG